MAVNFLNHDCPAYKSHTYNHLTSFTFVISGGTVADPWENTFVINAFNISDALMLAMVNAHSAGGAVIEARLSD